MLARQWSGEGRAVPVAAGPSGGGEGRAVSVAAGPSGGGGGRRRRERTVQRVLMALLLAVCLLGDWFLGQTTLLPDAALLRHLTDSATHGAVAFCCWGVFLCELALADRDFRRRHRLCFRRRARPQRAQRSLAPLPPPCAYYRKLVARCTLAGMVAALLDVDHFIAAGSFSIAGATHLQGRPFGHAVMFIAVLVAAVRRYARHRSAWTRRFRSSFVVVSLLSHQLRDGFRRGLWCWPLGSTPPIPYALYLVMEQGLPLVMAHWVLRVRDTRRSDDGDDDGGDGDDGRAVGLFVKAGQIDDSEEETLPLTAREEEDDDSDDSDADPRAFSGQLIV